MIIVFYFLGYNFVCKMFFIFLGYLIFYFKLVKLVIVIGILYIEDNFIVFVCEVKNYYSFYLLIV